MKKEELQHDSFVGKIVDMPFDEFEKYCAEENMGVLKGLENILTVIYNNLTEAKNKIIKKTLPPKRQDSKSTEINRLLLSVYAKMQMVETKIFYLREVQKERNAQVEDNLRKLKEDS